VSLGFECGGRGGLNAVDLKEEIASSFRSRKGLNEGGDDSCSLVSD
jgi:hypothetical protein